MKHGAARGDKGIEDSFLPELEAEEARLEKLLQAAKDESARRVLEAEKEAERRRAAARESLASELAEIRRSAEARALTERAEDSDALDPETMASLDTARARMPTAIQRLVEIAAGFRGLS
jgi:vacuolar-type H+-ATPase subunit H